MSLFWWLQTIRGAVPGGIIWFWTLVKSPHRTAFDETGIRIVSIDSSLERKFQQNDIWEALKLLRQHNPLHMRRVIEHISILFVRTEGAHGVYIRVGKICVLNLTSLKFEPSAKARQIAIAGLLVHEATHGVIGRMKIPYCGPFVKRIEKICNSEQSRITNKLAEIL